MSRATQPPRYLIITMNPKITIKRPLAAGRPLVAVARARRGPTRQILKTDRLIAAVTR
jgi:hypothetical protein